MKGQMILPCFYVLLCVYLCADDPCRVVYLAAYANIWVYPFLTKMPPVMMSLFFAGCYVISLILYFGGMLLSYIRYGSEFTCGSHHGWAVLFKHFASVGSSDLHT